MLGVGLTAGGQVEGFEILERYERMLFLRRVLVRGSRG